MIRPYIGLETYTEDKRDKFFGRSKEIKDLLSLIEKGPAVVIFGKSGSGKSSLVNAGLMPALREKFYLPIYVRLNFENDTEAFQTIEQAIREIDDSAPMFENLTLWEYAHQVSVLGGLVTPVMIIDQFEEVFTIGKGHKKRVENFLMDLRNLIENNVPQEVIEKFKNAKLPYDIGLAKFKVLINVREDYLPEFEVLSNYIPTLKKFRYRIAELTGEQALQAILQPAEGIIEEEEALQILRLLKSNKHERQELLSKQDIHGIMFAPFLLSFVCQQINEVRIERAEPTITMELLAQITIHNILESFYNEQMKNFGQSVKTFVEEKLISKEGYRKLVRKDEAMMTVGGAEGILQKLVECKLIRIVQRHEHAHVEIIHDRLVEIILEQRSKRQEQKADRKGKEKLRSKVRKKIYGVAGVTAVVSVFCTVLILMVQARYETEHQENIVFQLEKEFWREIFKRDKTRQGDIKAYNTVLKKSRE